MPQATHVENYRQQQDTSRVVSHGLQGPQDDWKHVACRFNSWRTWEASARGCKLRYPLLVGAHAPRPAEAPALQMRGCAQAKSIVLCIPLPVHLIVLAPAGRCVCVQAANALTSQAMLPEANNRQDAFSLMLLCFSRTSLVMIQLCSPSDSFSQGRETDISWALCLLDHSILVLHLCPGFAKFEIS